MSNGDELKSKASEVEPAGQGAPAGAVDQSPPLINNTPPVSKGAWGDVFNTPALVICGIAFTAFGMGMGWLLTANKFIDDKVETEMAKWKNADALPFVDGRLDAKFKEWQSEDKLPRGAKGLKGDTGDSGVPIGTIVAAGGLPVSDLDKERWLVCAGQTVSCAKYPQLYAVLKTQFGGAKDVSFNLPDLKGRFPLGQGVGMSSKSYELAEKGGENVHILTVAELPSHSHKVSDPGHTHSVDDKGNNDDPNTNGKLYVQSGYGNVGNIGIGHFGADAAPLKKAQTGITLEKTGGGEAFPIMPPFETVVFLIRAQ